MAASDAHPWMIKNQAYRITFPLYKNDGTLITGATGADSEISKDGGAFVDCTNEVTEIATASGWYYIDLTASECNANTVSYQFKCTNTGAMVVCMNYYPMSIDEPSSVPTWPMNLENALGWIAALARNKRYVTNTTQTLRNDADNATIATATVSDDATTGTRQEWT